jgi:hypothetical protein
MARPVRVSDRHQSTCVGCLGAGGDHLAPPSTARSPQAWPETDLHRARPATAGLAHRLPPGHGRPRAGHQRRPVLDSAPTTGHLAFPVPLHRRRRGKKTKCSHERKWLVVPQLRGGSLHTKGRTAGSCNAVLPRSILPLSAIQRQWLEGLSPNGALQPPPC